MKDDTMNSNHIPDLRQRIEARTCRFGVVGMGYVGLPLALAFAQRGIEVCGFDIDESKVASIQAGRTYLPGITDAEMRAVVDAGTLSATTDFSRLADMDVISICVPTPLSKSREPDLSYVDDAVRRVRKTLRPGQMIILESTTYPGMTQEYLLPRFERDGLQVGRDFFLAFSPEREDPGNETYGIVNTPKVVGGVEAASTEMAANFYKIAVESIHTVSSAAAAETVKLLENTFRSVNIGLVNEVALMCDRLGLDAREIIEAASTKPFGFMRFDPGPGIGGHCIPLDPLYLSWKLRSLDYRARFVELASDINTSMPEYLTNRIAAALNEVGRSLRGARILILGVAYKKDVDDCRESPALEVIRQLLRWGAETSYADPFVETISVGDHLFTAVEPSAEVLSAADCVVVTTDHTCFPWREIAARASLIVDARGAIPVDAVTGTLLPLSGPALVEAGVRADALGGARCAAEPKETTPA